MGGCASRDDAVSHFEGVSSAGSFGSDDRQPNSAGSANDALGSAQGVDQTSPLASSKAARRTSSAVRVCDARDEVTNSHLDASSSAHRTSTRAVSRSDGVGCVLPGSASNPTTPFGSAAGRSSMTYASSPVGPRGNLCIVDSRRSFLACDPPRVRGSSDAMPQFSAIAGSGSSSRSLRHPPRSGPSSGTAAHDIAAQLLEFVVCDDDPKAVNPFMPPIPQWYTAERPGTSGSASVTADHFAVSAEDNTSTSIRDVHSSAQHACRGAAASGRGGGGVTTMSELTDHGAASSMFSDSGSRPEVDSVHRDGKQDCSTADEEADRAVTDMVRRRQERQPAGLRIAHAGLTSQLALLQTSSGVQTPFSTAASFVQSNGVANTSSVVLPGQQSVAWSCAPSVFPSSVPATGAVAVVSVVQEFVSRDVPLGVVASLPLGDFRKFLPRRYGQLPPAAAAEVACPVNAPTTNTIKVANVTPAPLAVGGISTPKREEEDLLAKLLRLDAEQNTRHDAPVLLPSVHLSPLQSPTALALDSGGSSSSASGCAALACSSRFGGAAKERSLTSVIHTDTVRKHQGHTTNTYDDRRSAIPPCVRAGSQQVELDGVAPAAGQPSGIVSLVDTSPTCQSLGFQRLSRVPSTGSCGFAAHLKGSSSSSYAAVSAATSSNSAASTSFSSPETGAALMPPRMTLPQFHKRDYFAELV